MDTEGGAERSDSVAGSAAAAGLEESHWLCPIKDRRRLDSPRERMIDGLSLGNNPRLVDFTANNRSAARTIRRRARSESEVSVSPERSAGTVP
jgi:hypothetical protein